MTKEGFSEAIRDVFEISLEEISDSLNSLRGDDAQTTSENIASIAESLDDIASSLSDISATLNLMQVNQG